MATTSELSQFRRLVGDYSSSAISDAEAKTWLDDATREATEDLLNYKNVPTPLTDFDTLPSGTHTEVIYLAAINWWWAKAAEYTEKVSQRMGDGAVDVSTKYDRALQMIDMLQKKWEDIQVLTGADVYMDNLSRFSKGTLTRLGGEREEDALG